MLKLSYQLLLKRKWFVSAIIGIISFSATLAIFTNITTNSIYEQQKELALKTYGSFISGVNDISLKDAEKIRNNEKIKKGFFELYQNITLGDHVFTIGYGDTDFLDMTNVVLESGVMPQRDNEVVVERFVAEIYGVSEVGEEIDLLIDESKKAMKVTGIVRNYSNQLSVHYRLEKGVNNYPNIFCANASELFVTETQPVLSALLGFLSSDDIGISQLSTINKMQEIVEEMSLSAPYVYDNDNLFNRGLLYCNAMKLIGNIISVIMVLSTVFCSWSVLRVFYREYGVKLAILMACGLRKRQGIYIVGIQLLFFTFISILISIFSGMLINYCFGELMFPTINSSFNFSSVKFSCIWFGILYLFLFYLFFNIFSNIFKTSVYQAISKGIFYTHKNPAKKPLGFDVQKGMRRFHIGITSIFVILFAICFIAINAYYDTEGNYDAYPDYELFAKEIVETEIVDGYEIEYNYNSYFPLDTVERIKDFNNNIIVDSYPNVTSKTLLLRDEQMSSYFKSWCSEYNLESTEYEQSVIKKQWANEADQFTPIPNVDFIIANKEQLVEICREYELNVSVDNMLDGSGMLMFLPENSINENTGIQIGDRISLGGINFRTGNVSFYSTSVCAEAIVASKYEHNINGYIQEREGITIVVSDKLAKKDEFFEGYRQLRVYKTSGLNEKSDKELDNIINIIQSNVQGGILYSKRATEEAEVLYASYVRGLGVALMLIIVAFVIIFIYTQIYSSMKEKEKEYGILRALGMSVERISGNIAISYASSALVSFMVDALLVIIYAKMLGFTYTVESVIFSGGIVIVLVLVSKLLSKKLIQKAGVRRMMNS